MGKKLIHSFHERQVKEAVRELDLDGHQEKRNTPTMGGIAIITAIVIPTLLFAKLTNTYIILLLTASYWFCG